MNISANFKAVPLAGTMGEGELGGNGITGTSVHRVYCLAAGTATITAKGGGTFTWNALTNDFIDVVVKQVTITSGTFIGFKSKMYGDQIAPYNS